MDCGRKMLLKGRVGAENGEVLGIELSILGSGENSHSHGGFMGGRGKDMVIFEWVKSGEGKIVE